MKQLVMFPDAMKSKTCPVCGLDKTTNDFTPNSQRRDGFCWECRDCGNKRSTSLYARNKEKRRAYHRAWYWANHKSELKRSTAKNRRCRADPEYRARHKDDWKKYREKYPEKSKQRAKYYKSLYRARLLNSEGSHTMNERREILDRYEHKCLRCGSTENLSFDHIVPLSRGGTNYAANLQPLCIPCNAQKHTRYVDYRPDAYWSDWL